MAWRPNLWIIPILTELHQIESFLTTPLNPGAEFVRGDERVVTYFSATAICIATLARISSDIRKSLRLIILQENCRGVGNPEVHAEGLIPYCTANPNMRVHMQAGLSTVLALSLWAIQLPLSSLLYSAMRGRIHNYIRILVDWLVRTATLPSLGMPAKSFSVTLDLCSKEALFIWEYTEKAAAARDNLPEALVSHDEREGTESGVLMAMYARLWRLLVTLSSPMRDIISDASIVRLQTPGDDRPKTSVPVESYATWSLIDWILAYRPVDEDVRFPGDPEKYIGCFFASKEST